MDNNTAYMCAGLNNGWFHIFGEPDASGKRRCISCGIEAQTTTDTLELWQSGVTSFASLRARNKRLGILTRAMSRPAEAA